MPETITKLKALRERVRAATGPDRELDVRLWAEFLENRDVRENAANLILAKARTPPFDECILGWIDPGEHRRNFSLSGSLTVPKYTASIDAALALVMRKREELSLPVDWSYQIISRALVTSWNWWRNDANWPSEWPPHIPRAIIDALLTAVIEQQKRGAA